MIDKSTRTVAYFSMEIGLTSKIPTYAGGLGILAGDSLKACADLQVPIVSITLLSEKGYFAQELDAQGNQKELPLPWDKENFLTKLPQTVLITLENREIQVGVWEYIITGVTSYQVPVYFLDTNVEGNTAGDREITSYLYGGDQRHRFFQEAVLGIGGVKILEKLGYHGITDYHLNEGHSSLLTLELAYALKEKAADTLEREVEKRCSFTTHTPVPTGHDKFPWKLATEVLEDSLIDLIPLPVRQHKELNMTLLALEMSHYINGVAKKHADISKDLFPGYPIHSITNGVHSATWTSLPFQALYDKFIPDWRKDPCGLRAALSIPKDEIWNAHQEAKRNLVDYVNKQTDKKMTADYFTLGYARRFTGYKRPYILFEDIDRLKQTADNLGPLQIIYAGKAHSKDTEGKKLIKKIFQLSQELSGNVNLVFLPNYDLDLAKLLTAGVDVWLNTPLPPYEASGTSGMKAAHNGIPHLSVLDGWWLEGHIEGVTGWSIGSEERKTIEPSSNQVIKLPSNQWEEFNRQDAKDLYDKLEEKIVPLFYRDKNAWLNVMRHTIALNASFFNTHRMVQEYVTRAYFD